MSDSGLDDWVITDDIPTIATRLQVIREGVPGLLEPQPATAMQILQTFALRRPIADLLPIGSEAGDPGRFARLDATVVLALASLTRPVREAARLAVEQWAMESPGSSGESPRTSSIVHDVTAQRTVQEVAVFIAECRRRAPSALVSKILAAFVMTTSGRTNLDQALLYIALREEGDTADADELLKLILEKASRDARAAERPARQQVGIVGALRHFSPSQGIVERWIDQQMAVADREPATVELVASLLVSEPGDCDALAGHVGRTWKPRRLIDLCAILTRRSDPIFRLVRGHAAARTDTDSLADIVQYWHESDALAGTLRSLLAEIVTGGADGLAAPRPVGFLEDICVHMRNNHAPGRCLGEMRVAIATHVAGRSGHEVASLLGRVGQAHRRRAAQAVNQQLTARLLAGQVTTRVFVDYVKGLADLPEATNLTFWVVRELSDPTASDHALEGTAWVIGDIADLLFAENHGDTAFDLLERCLENEQWLKADDAVAVVERIRQGRMPGDERWSTLLSSTVGRWAETPRRDEVVAALRRQDYHTDAEAVIQPVQ